MRKIALLCICLIIATFHSFAQDIINLKNGQKIKGKIMQLNKNYAKISVENVGLVLTYDWLNIENIVFGEGTSTEQKNKTINKESIIKGNVKFPGYKQGYIRITVFDKADKKTRRLVGITQIPNPGPFTLNVPPEIKTVYLSAFNDSDNDDLPYKKHDPVGWYGYPGQKKPILINKPVTNNILLELHRPKR